MPFTQTNISGLKIFEPAVFNDERGYFLESFNENIFKQAGIQTKFVQDNESKSSKGVLRGLHYQLNPAAQAKLVRVVTGSVLDVVIDIRKNSPTFGQYFSIVLSAENKKQLFIPRGFAHGFLVLENHTVFQYKCDNFYSKEHERGILWNDPAIAINWGNNEKYTLSEKDKNLPDIKHAENNFKYIEQNLE